MVIIVEFQLYAGQVIVLAISRESISCRRHVDVHKGGWGVGLTWTRGGGKKQIFLWMPTLLIINKLPLYKETIYSYSKSTVQYMIEHKRLQRRNSQGSRMIKFTLTFSLIKSTKQCLLNN